MSVLIELHKAVWVISSRLKNTKCTESNTKLHVPSLFDQFIFFKESFWIIDHFVNWLKRINSKLQYNQTAHYYFARKFYFTQEQQQLEMSINYRHFHDVWDSTNVHDFSRPEKHSVFHDSGIPGFQLFFQLTSLIILQLLQGPIWENTCRMRASVTSLERFPTYLKTQENTANWETRSMRRVFPSSLKPAAHSARFHFCHVFSALEPTANMLQKPYLWEKPRRVNRLSVWFRILHQRKVW